MEILVNGEKHTFSAPISCAALLEGLGLARNTVAVELNGAIVPRTGLEGQALTCGDSVEIVRFIGGG